MNSSKAGMVLPLISHLWTKLIPCQCAKSNADEDIIGVAKVVRENGFTPGLFQRRQRKLIWAERRKAVPLLHRF